MKRALCVGINDYPVKGADLKGCVNDAKAWAAVLVDRFGFEPPNVTLLLHASVVDLATGGDPGWVDRVELRREDGSRCFVRARLVVLAAGGIENPRLLLLSRPRHSRAPKTDAYCASGEREASASGLVRPRAR